jgi:branched-chain amino acid transport system ATP-binding protein
MLQVSNLTKYFGGLAAVNDLSFGVEKGEIVGLVGPNGAGKTTVLNLITGFYQPSKGNVTFEGRDITGKKPSVIAALGLTRSFQSSVLFDHQT